MSKVIHGHARRNPDGTRNYSPEWRSYQAMKTRCLNPNAERYKDYGGRGIKICDRWVHGSEGLNGFQCFLEDMGKRPYLKATIDRADNNGDYEPSNCSWESQKNQANNTRNTRLVCIYGQQMSFANAVQKFGKVSIGTARMRLHRGWDDVAAITTPIQSQ